MTAPASRLDPDAFARGFARASQYLANVMASADVLSEAGGLVRSVFAADVVCLCQRTCEDCPLRQRLGESLRPAVDQVFESGLMAMETVDLPARCTYAILPINVRSRTEAVLLVGYQGAGTLPPYALEALLGVAGLIGATLARQRADRELLMLAEERTERVAADRSRRELRDLVEKLPLGVFVERAGRIVYANPALAEYLGCPAPADLVGKEPAALLAPEELERAGGRDPRQEWASQRGSDRELHFTKSDGSAVTLEGSAAREIDFEGRPSLLCVLRDVTELKSMQARLMQADRMASVGLLAAGVAHEINNPLAYLIGTLDFLEEELRSLEPLLPGGRLCEAHAALADARGGAERVKHVVRDLRTFSRADEERRAGADLRSAIEPAINMVQKEIRYRARLVTSFGPTPLVLVNEARLGQVFLNLFLNAVQAIPEGHVEENEIRVRTRTDEAGRAVVEVHDTGRGIPREDLERIFDPFFTTKAIGAGTGLGLSICRNIVTAFGGEILVESAVGRGTVFQVVLPPAPPDPAGHEARPAPTPAPPARGRRGRLLAVDDEPAILAALRRTLAGEHDIVALTDAREARDRIARGERFDAILCDLMMPGMTGMELHAALEELAPDQARRMVLLTGGAFTPGASEFLARVPNARLDKPFDAAALRALVRSQVR